MSFEDSLESLSLDYLNLLINGQAFSDVTFSVEGRLVHAHRCVLSARSHFFRKLFSGQDPPPSFSLLLDGPNHLSLKSPVWCTNVAAPSRGNPPRVISLNSLGYEVFLLVLQFIYSGHLSLVPQKHEPPSDCPERGCSHTHCTSAIDLALNTLAAARSFGVEQLALLTEKQLASMVEKASIEDVMKVLIVSHEHDIHQLLEACSYLVAKSGLPPAILAKHLPLAILSKIEELRIKSYCCHPFPFPLHHHLQPIDLEVATELDQQQMIRRMRRALDLADVELVRLMVMGEGLNLDDAHALHYAVEHCSRDVVKALLELGAADVNHSAGPSAKTPLHLAAEMVSPDMVSVLLDHQADPSVRTADGVTPLSILRNLTTDFLFKGAVPALTHIGTRKLRLCMELVQSAMLVLLREEADACGGSESNRDKTTYQPLCAEAIHSDATTSGGHNFDSVMLYLNLGMPAGYQMGCPINHGHQENDGGATPHGGGVIGPSSMYSSHHLP